MGRGVRRRAGRPLRVRRVQGRSRPGPRPGNQACPAELRPRASHRRGSDRSVQASGRDSRPGISGRRRLADARVPAPVRRLRTGLALAPYADLQGRDRRGTGGARGHPPRRRDELRGSLAEGIGTTRGQRGFCPAGCLAAVGRREGRPRGLPGPCPHATLQAQFLARYVFPEGFPYHSGGWRVPALGQQRSRRDLRLEGSLRTRTEGVVARRTGDRRTAGTRRGGIPRRRTAVRPYFRRGEPRRHLRARARQGVRRKAQAAED